jgi:hypothetical protein
MQHFEITGSFSYLNEKEESVEEIFTVQTITTKDVSTLPELEISFNSGEIFSNKVQIKNFKINSDLKK